MPQQQTTQTQPQPNPNSDTNMNSSHVPLLLGLTWLCALLSPTATRAVLLTPRHSRIELGGNKCLSAPDNIVSGQPLVVVNCTDYDQADVRLRFVFGIDEDSIGQIKLFANRELCVDVPNGQLLSALGNFHCDSGAPENKQFRVLAKERRIQWHSSRVFRI
jgi:hypothetical protein